MSSLIYKTKENLNVVRQEAESLASSWNGGDEKFNHEGTLHHSSDAEFAVDLMKEIDNLIESLDYAGEIGLIN